MAKIIKVAYQGIAGAYSHLACYAYFGQEIKCIENETFEDAMQKVEKGRADFALIPIENKTAGRVDEFYGLIPEMKLQIVGEHYQKIEHCLLGIKNVYLSDIKYVYSHPQGLAQCRNNLKKFNLKPVALFDTAGSAQEVAKLQERDKAAIASSLAAEIYGLQILDDNIQDKADNYTRFIVLAKDRGISSDSKTSYVTSLIFEVKNIPSALYQALGGFARNSVNILKIESYIPLGHLEESHFHIDVDGFIDSDAVQDALKELEKYSKKIKILGSYEKNRVIKSKYEE